jgi:hypothetical protein
MEAPPFNPRTPHGVHTETGKIPVFDQSGYLYDGITEQPLDFTEEMKANYAYVEGMPFSRAVTEHEKLQTALATIRASGAVDPDSMAKFEKMLVSIQQKQGTTEVTVKKTYKIDKD